MIRFRWRRKLLQRTVLLTAEAAESTFSLFMQMDESVEQHYENIWQIHPLCTVFAGGSCRTEGQPRTVGLRSSQKVPKNNLHHQRHHGHPHRYKLLNPLEEGANASSIVGFRQGSKVTSWLKGYLVG